jgi:hypothetical protein
MTEVQEAKTRLLEWAKQADAAPSPLSLGGMAPALGMAAAGLVLGRLLPGGKHKGGLVSSLIGNAFSLATIVPIAKVVLPILLKKR